MLSKLEIEQQITEAIKPMDIMVYDFEFVSGRNKIARLFIEGIGEREVGIDDCVKVNKTLRRVHGLEAFMSQYSLEVSTPGINRDLKRPEHYEQAVGRQIKIYLKFAGEHGDKLSGLLKEFANSTGIIELADDEKSEVGFKLVDVRSARINEKIMQNVKGQKSINSRT